MAFEIQWSERAVEELDGIITQIQDKWGYPTSEKFKKELSGLLKVIGKYPDAFPISTYNNRLRKAVISKQCSVY